MQFILTLANIKSQGCYQLNNQFKIPLDNSQSPFDQDDKEVAESMLCSTNYPLQFEACMVFFSLSFPLFVSCYY
jgi:hypothetical protein